MEDKAKSLEGRVALVTGGGRGIGRAIAKSLAAAGSPVAVVARSIDELNETVSQIEEAGGRAIALSVDVTDEKQVALMVRETEAKLGPIEMLVNDAGVVGQAGPVRQADTTEWWRVMDVNLRGPLLCTHAVLPGMSRQKRGHIVNIASGAGCFPWKNVSAYAVSKAALIRFSEILALETADDNIAVFSLKPGVVRTAMTEKASSAEWREWDTAVSEAFEDGRDVPPEEAARLTLELMSGKVDVLSGRMIGVSDDIDQMVREAERIREEDLYVLKMNEL